MMTLPKDDDITQDINILRTDSLSQETIRFHCFRPEIVSHAHKDPYTWNIQIFQKFEKFKFYPKITKTGVIKNVDRHLINSRNYASAYYQTLEEVRGPLLPEKNKKKHDKFQLFEKNCLNS